jgi:urease beta subunit
MTSRSEGQVPLGTPGEIVYGDGPVTINAGRQVITVEVVNTADRPITVGSHYHFAEANPALRFDRKAAWGYRQNIIAGGMTRFDPGITQHVELVPFVGRRIAAGFRGACGGPLDA